jgi:hypothetical protein
LGRPREDLVARASQAAYGFLKQLGQRNLLDLL